MMRHFHIQQVNQSGLIEVVVANIEEAVILAQILEASPEVEYFKVWEAAVPVLSPAHLGHGGSGFKKWKH